MDANDLTPQTLQNSGDLPSSILPGGALGSSTEQRPPPARNLGLHAILLLATCVTTFNAGVVLSDHYTNGSWLAIAHQLSWPAVKDGLIYSAAVMAILLCHEMGHFLQACRYGVNASLPYFIPCPIPPLGTFGAVIRMEPDHGDRRAIFDIGISGPLAGLVPTFLFLCLGLSWSHSAPIPPGENMTFGEPLVMQYLTHWIIGPIPPKWGVDLHPLAFAAWVGLLVTSINLIPIGQLDGGHILYGMFRKKAHVGSMAVLILAISAALAFRLTNWWFMLALITVLGTRHPPTADDSVPLGFWRYVLGVLTLAFLIVGFTPVPVSL